MSAWIIWLTAALAYAIFWYWYVGFAKKITPEEAEATMRLFEREGSWSVVQQEHLRKFLLEDDGKDFVMVNLIHLKSPRRESREKLARYQKVFLGALLRKAGHPVMIATAASGNVENVDCEHCDGWGAAGMIRYRSRRDLMEILPSTIGSAHHNLKLESLEKTFAFPASPWFMLGGPRIVVALAIALMAAFAQLALN
ncbi:Uncharacterised protein [Halioglobus japonicus]|nr:Uncharacterised protein [Halioglobus japonicus]